MALAHDLERLEELINGLNYVTMLEAHDMVHAPNLPQSSIIQKCIPDADPIDFAGIDVDELISSFSKCVLYPRHLGHGPPKGAFDQPEFIKLFADVESQIRALSVNSSPHVFSFRSNRPYAPIFWNFSFLLHGSEKSTVLVGASWD